MSENSIVLVISTPEDIHADGIQSVLTRSGIRNVRFDTATFPLSSNVIHEVGKPTISFLRTIDDRVIKVSDIRSIWWRRPASPKFPDAIADEATSKYVNANTHYAFEGLMSSLDCLWVNNIWAQRQSMRKPYQFEVSLSCDLTLPQTLITNCPEAVREFHKRAGPLIYKSLEKVVGVPDGTKLLKADDLDRLDQLVVSPAIFQKYIPPGYDLRITYIDGDFFAAKITSDCEGSQYDIRLDMNPEIVPYALPSVVRAQLTDLMDKLGLLFAAIDIRVADDGRYYFLEANPAGQWVYIEMQTEQPITERLAQLLGAGSSQRR